jgi:hypothetical protein
MSLYRPLTFADNNNHNPLYKETPSSFSRVSLRSSSLPPACIEKQYFNDFSRELQDSTHRTAHLPTYQQWDGVLYHDDRCTIELIKEDGDVDAMEVDDGLE